MAEQSERRPVLEWADRWGGKGATVGVFRLAVAGREAKNGREGEWFWSVEVRPEGSHGHVCIVSDGMTDGYATKEAAQIAAEDAARSAGIAVPANRPKTSDGCTLLSAAKQMIKAMQPICYQKWPHRVDAFNALRAAVEAAEATDAV